MTDYDYKKELDYLIFDILFTEGSYRYRSLKRKIEERFPTKKQVSFNTFDYHLKKLVDRNLLEKQDKKYSLTQKSRLWMEKKRSLEVLLLDSGVIVPPRYT